VHVLLQIVLPSGAQKLKIESGSICGNACCWCSRVHDATQSSTGDPQRHNAWPKKGREPDVAKQPQPRPAGDCAHSKVHPTPQVRHMLNDAICPFQNSEVQEAPHRQHNVPICNLHRSITCKRPAATQTTNSLTTMCQRRPIPQVPKPEAVKPAALKKHSKGLRAICLCNAQITKQLRKAGRQQAHHTLGQSHQP
jgi:pyruvate/2-oxoglutarate dehydrogenase complex dihydrolipoamide acyltransferase (E2) component